MPYAWHTRRVKFRRSCFSLRRFASHDTTRQKIVDACGGVARILLATTAWMRRKDSRSSQARRSADRPTCSIASDTAAPPATFSPSHRAYDARVGAWGTSLYSGDFALDLRSTIAVLARLPFDGDRIFSVIRDMEPGAADNPADADHTTFWLVLADQFHRRGIAAEAVRSRALSLIDSGSDTETMRKLGMKES